MLTKEGIILKTIPYLEQAKIAHVLTEAGKESFIIRGASKMKSSNRAMAQMLTKIAFNATEKGTLRTITESKVLDDYDAIKQDYDKMQSVYPILEKLYSFSDQVNNARTLYEFTSQILELL